MKCQTKYCRNDALPYRKYCAKCRSRQYKEKNFLNYTYLHLKKAAIRRGKEFKLTLEEFKTFCDETNYLELRGRTKAGYHIDRIDHRKGYEVGNIQILSASDNSRKGIMERYECPF